MNGPQNYREAERLCRGGRTDEALVHAVLALAAATAQSLGPRADLHAEWAGAIGLAAWRDPEAEDGPPPWPAHSCDPSDPRTRAACAGCARDGRARREAP
ncbi:hypothetical protein [Actinomadura formosensis]|uniref:hypothetical protein n=1 Tax=Actinomadura formosensis TaxID=60706 RepID=UPI003D8B49B2